MVLVLVVVLVVSVSGAFLRPKNEWGSTSLAIWDDVVVSSNRGTPKSSILVRVFPYKSSILGYPILGNLHVSVRWVRLTGAVGNGGNG